MAAAEECLFSHSKCHVFRLPPNNTLRSADWEGNHIWTGVVKVVRRRVDPTDILSSSSHAIRLEDPDTGNVFGECPLLDDANGPKCFQSASDSTRCFILRVARGKQHAYIGLNFDDRSAAFNFSTVVTERNRHSTAPKPLEEVNRALTEGERIVLDLSGKLRSTQQQQQQPASATAGPPKQQVSLDARPPPPKGASRRITSD